MDQAPETRDFFTSHRRSFFLSCGAASAVGMWGATASSCLALDALTREQRDAMSPDDVIELAKKGNKRFLAGIRQERDFLREQTSSAAGQFPAMIVLSCVDSRAPAEIIMDLGIGDAFNARVAGNIANDDILGSMEFACAAAGAKLVLVMGHTACGAIKGAIDEVELGNLTGLLAKIRPAVDATKFDGDRISKNASFVDAVARTNVERTVAAVREQSAVLRDLESKGSVKVVGAMYDIHTAAVTFLA